MAKFPVLVQAVVITAFFSGLVNYAVMPILARLLRRWWRPAGSPAT
jgi:antibiotic biosynthesis monooxygenase (ABM) superfamily enzyme